MKSASAVSLVVTICCLLVEIRTSPVSAGEAARFRIVQNDAYLVVLEGRRPILQYRYDGVPAKPYIKELFTPGGMQLLRDAPADHLHHHGIMFAISADGVTYWEEKPEGGKQVPREMSIPEVAARPEQSPIAIRHQLDWVAPGAAEPVLQEQRTISVLSLDGADATLIGWTSSLTPGAGRQQVELSGAHYYGLGMRLLQSLDRTGRFLYASGEAGEIVRGQERLTPSKWCAYVVPVEAPSATVAIFDHPNNVRHPALMFTMPEAFAYLSATLNLWKEPITLQAGRPLELHFCVAAWDGEATESQIEDAYAQWLRVDAERPSSEE